MNYVVPIRDQESSIHIQKIAIANGWMWNGGEDYIPGAGPFIVFYENFGRKTKVMLFGHIAHRDEEEYTPLSYEEVLLYLVRGNTGNMSFLDL